MVEGWEAIRAWRRAMRAELIGRRLAVPRDERLRVRSAVGELIAERFPELREARIGFYWPFRGEIDLRRLVEGFMALGAEAALPVVVEKHRPLAFSAWRPGTKLTRGFWNIPVPAAHVPVRPTALLVPLVGFDAAGYRLGYGGGYYDRTLAALDPRPLTIGVGYEFGRLETIHPQPHDVPLDAIVTEAGCVRLRDRGEPLVAPGEASLGASGAARGEPSGLGVALAPQDDDGSYASPPCFMHELDPTYLGYMSRSETIAFLEGLLAASHAAGEPTTAPHTAEERARLRDMLAGHLARLRALASHPPPVGEAPARPPGRGWGWVVGQLRDGLHRIGDEALHRDLKSMLEADGGQGRGAGSPPR